MKKSSVIAGSVALAATGAFVAWSMRRTIPRKAVAINPFEVDRFLGKWYEVARLDYKFDRNIINTSIDFSLRYNGHLKVVKRWYNYYKKRKEIKIGTAKFIGPMYDAMMKISYRGPLYTGYNVIGIDPEYKYALVAGEDLRHLWLLSREHAMPEDIKKAFIHKAGMIGYDTSKLIWIDQNQPLIHHGALIEYTQIDQDLS
ncbi:lipocalin family protein [Parabacteroides sp. OttesenSCG-928-G06]|nr:lipocalin family protein [Parabacteroides sp. OttesenSCG-928-K15]MDL2282752.1 lipocalin family protein [Parabacteroides sp. OttesenSCG-928-G06]